MESPMAYDPDIHRRRSIRLDGFDYASAGAYFITICTANRECLFGEITKNVMHLSVAGGIVEEEWHRSALMRTETELDAWVIMPNHVHGIVMITGMPNENAGGGVGEG